MASLNNCCINEKRLVRKSLQKWSRTMTEILGFEEMVDCLIPNGSNILNKDILEKPVQDFDEYFALTCFLCLNKSKRIQTPEITHLSVKRDESSKITSQDDLKHHQLDQQNYLKHLFDYMSNDSKMLFNNLYGTNIKIQGNCSTNSFDFVEDNFKREELIEDISKKECIEKLIDDEEDEEGENLLNRFKENLFKCLIERLISQHLRKEHRLNMFNEGPNSQVNLTINMENCLQHVRKRVLKRTINFKYFQDPLKSDEDIHNLENDHITLNNHTTQISSSSRPCLSPASQLDPLLKLKRNKRGQYRKYESNQLNKAMDAVINKNMSLHKAGNFFGVPHTTLEYKCKEKLNGNSFYFDGSIDSGSYLVNENKRNYLDICLNNKRKLIESLTLNACNNSKLTFLNDTITQPSNFFKAAGNLFGNPTSLLF